MSLAKRNSSSTSVCTLDLACNLLRLKSFPSKRYLIGISSVWAWQKTSSWTMLKLIHSLVNSICHRKWIRKLALILDPSNHTVVEQPHYCCESGWRAKLCHNFPKSITTDCVKCFGMVHKGHVEVHILFLAFLLKLSCCEDHVCCFSVLPESTLAFWKRP